MNIHLLNWRNDSIRDSLGALSDDEALVFAVMELTEAVNEVAKKLPRKYV